MAVSTSALSACARAAYLSTSEAPRYTTDNVRTVARGRLRPYPPTAVACSSSDVSALHDVSTRKGTTALLQELTAEGVLYGPRKGKSLPRSASGPLPPDEWKYEPPGGKLMNPALIALHETHSRPSQPPERARAGGGSPTTTLDPVLPSRRVDAVNLTKLLDSLLQRDDKSWG